MRKRSLAAVSLALTLTGLGPASAQVIDMNTVTCKNFTDFNKDIMFAVVMWLDAYYRDEDDPPVIDFDAMGKKAARLGAYCVTNPGHSLTTAAEPIMSK